MSQHNRPRKGSYIHRKEQTFDDFGLRRRVPSFRTCFVAQKCYLYRTTSRTRACREFGYGYHALCISRPWGFPVHRVVPSNCPQFVFGFGMGPPRTPKNWVHLYRIALSSDGRTCLEAGAERGRRATKTGTQT